MKFEAFKISFEKVGALWFGYFGFAPIIGLVYAAVRLEVLKASVPAFGPILWTFLLWCLPNLVAAYLLVKGVALGWVLSLFVWISYLLVFSLASSLTDVPLPSQAMILLVLGTLLGVGGLLRRRKVARNDKNVPSVSQGARLS